MLGQSISMVLPKGLGYKITGKMGQLTTSTDVVLTITKHLRTICKFISGFLPTKDATLLQLCGPKMIVVAD